MSLITVNQETCTQCNACVESCPILIIDNNHGAISIPDENTPRCINCGHCEAVCPTGSLIHEKPTNSIQSTSRFPASVDAETLASYFSSRRSIRKYLDKPVDKAILEKIMDAVRYAPSGTNRQPLHWTIINDKEVIKKIASLTIEWMRSAITSNSPAAQAFGFQRYVDQFEAGIDIICRDAHHLVFCYSIANYPVGQNDAIIATTQLELLLPAYGLGACWAGYAMMATKAMPEIRQLIGINDRYSVHTALLLGYPKHQYHRLPFRNKVDIKWIGGN
jgi:nitroreductase/NAD-dependent dihydropyrimidine dehydrogenase PreA subunit